MALRCAQKTRVILILKSWAKEASRVWEGAKEILKDAEVINIRFFSRRKPREDYMKRWDEQSLVSDDEKENYPLF